MWEGVVAGLFAGTRVLSIRQHALAVADALGGESAAATPSSASRWRSRSASSSSLLAAALAVRRLERVELRGETA